jgi:hypothetical protein
MPTITEKHAQVEALKWVWENDELWYFIIYDRHDGYWVRGREYQEILEKEN